MSRKKIEADGACEPSIRISGGVQDAVLTIFPADFNRQREAARAAYVAWLASQPEDAFAPATHAEVLALYDTNCGTTPLAPALGTSRSIAERIAESESIPSRKAALDRARVRRALAALRVDEVAQMTPEQAIDALCQTPEGRAQYDHIRTKAPGSRYKPLRRLDDGVSPSELIACLSMSPELAAEFERANKDVRESLGLEGDQPRFWSLTGAVAELLGVAGCSIAAGIESEGAWEPEWSRDDKALLGAIAVTVPKISQDKATDVAASDLQAALHLLVRARDSLASGFESDGPDELEWSKGDKALVDRIDSVLKNVNARELLALAAG